MLGNSIEVRSIQISFVLESSLNLNSSPVAVCYVFTSCCPPLQDPHDELKGQNVLIVRGSEEETAAKFGVSLDDLRRLLATALSTLRDARQRRPRPHLDDKMLAAWNGASLSFICFCAIFQVACLLLLSETPMHQHLFISPLFNCIIH